MKELGLEVFDSNGKLRPLNETFQDLNSKLGEMSDEDRINVLNTMFNKVDLKSVNALLANSGERFDELSGYIRDSAGAAEEMAETMNDNLKGKLTILGSALEGLGIEMYEEFQQPLKEAAETAIKSVDSISASLKNGKLSESMASVARGIGTIVSKAAELAIGALPKLIDGFAFLVDHAKLLGTVLASTAGAVVTFKSTMLINDIVKSWNAAATAARMFGAGMTSSLTGAQAVVGGLTGNISKLGAVKAALGGPMGVAALAVAGVTAGIVALSLATDEVAKAEKEEREAREKFIKSIERENEKIEEIRKTKEESLSIAENEISTIENQIRVLEDLVDADGKVKEGQEGRAKVLAEEINSVIPNAITLSEKEGDTYLTTAENLEKLIKQKRINAVLSAGEEAYTQALKERPALLENLTKVSQDYNEALEEVETIQNRLNNLGPSPLIGEEPRLKSDLRAAKDVVEELKNTLDETTEAFNENEKSISNYVDISTAVAEENTEKIDEILQGQLDSLKQYGADTKEEAQKQYEEAVAQRQAAEAAFKDINDVSAQEYLSSLKNNEANAKAIRDNAYAEAEQASRAAGEAQVVAMADGINGQVEAVKAAALRIKDEAIETIKGIQEAMQTAGKNAALGFANGLKDGISMNSIMNNVTSLGNIAITHLNKSIDSHSPSRKAEKSGKNFDEGFAIGIEKNKGLAIESVEELAESSLATAREQAEEYKDIGDLFGENYLAGLEEKLDTTTELIEKNTDKSIKAYEDFIDEQTESAVQKINEQTDAEVEALEEQISKLKDVKDKGQKEANKAEIKELEKQIKAIKENGKKRTQNIKDDAKEQKDAYKKGMQEIEKAGLDVIKKATNDIEKEYESRKDSIVEEYQSQKDAILSLQDNLYSKTSDYGELFHYNDETGEMLLNDLTENTKAVNQYYDSLEKLSNIDGISDSFVRMIATEYDVEEGTKIINELLKMGDTRLQAYASEWDKLQEISSQRSKQFLDDELSVIDASFNQEINKLKNDLPEMTRQALADSVNEIATVFPEKYAELIQLDPEFFNNMLNTLNTEILGNLSEQEGIVVPIKAEAENFPEEVTKQIPGIQEAGSEATIALGKQIGKDGKEVVSEADDVGSDTVRALESHEPEFQQVGENYMDRLIDGMQSKWGTAVGVAHEIAESLKDELEDVASFSMRDTDDAMSARSLMESVEPAMISRLYDSMVDSIGFYQSRLAAASTSYITNNSSSRVENNMGDVNFNIAEVKGENVDRSINKLMEQAEFYRRQKRLAVGVK